MIATQLAAERLVRVRHSVFLDAAHWPAETADQHIVRARAETVVNDDAVISHASAALIWQLPAPGFADWTEAPVTLTLPAGGRYRSRRGPVTLVIGDLPAAHVTRDASGYRVTTRSRTAIDLVKNLALPQALVVLDAAARSTCATFVANIRRTDYANPRLRNSAVAELEEVAKALDFPWFDALATHVNPSRESPAESLTAGHIELAGLPRPLYQAEVRTVAGTLYPDCLWPAERLVGECDGAVKYGDPSSIVREKEREQVLRDEGFRMVRWLAKEIMTRPDLVMGRIERELGSG